MQPDPTIHLWMLDQELGRTMRQNALVRAVKEAQDPGDGFRVNRFDAAIRGGIKAVTRALRPAGTGSA
jgi:hypothetical protein